MALRLFGFKERMRGLDMPIPPPPEELPEFPALPAMDEEPEEERSLVEKFRSKAVAKEKQELEKQASEPVFLKVKAFKAVVAEVGQIREHAGRGESMLSKLESLQQEEERALRQWREAARELHEKLIFVDEMLFKRG